MLDRIFASLMFFTRLPWWRLREVPSEAFKHTVDFWPLAGWVTGGCMALSFLLLFQVLPLSVAVIMAVGVRLLLTGALHEDGLADFCDGMGGGTSRERTLAIMKDSHIGTYGVLGLICYFALLCTSLVEMSSANLGALLSHTFSFSFDYNPAQGMQLSPNSLTSGSLLMTAATMLFADVYAKSIASFIITLPYARDEEGAKAHVVYHNRASQENLTHLLRCLLLLALPLILLYWSGARPHFLTYLTPIVVFLLLRYWIKRKIAGYTGDCCGAVFLICELSFLLVHLAFLMHT